MRQATWIDQHGRKWETLLPDGQPDEAAPSGMPLGPISLEPLHLPLDYEVRLHNELHARRLYGLEDVLRRPKDVTAAVQAATRASAHAVIDLFRERSGT